MGWTATEGIKVEDYNKTINNLIDANEELKQQLEYANEQLETQATIISRLRDYTISLNEKAIENIMEG